MTLEEGRLSVELSELHEAPNNPRDISDERLADLKYAVEKVPGLLTARPLIVEPDGTVIAGNMRLRAMRELGWTEAPCHVKKFESEEERREWAMLDNHPFGDWVPDQLAAEIALHRDADGDMRLLGFREQQLDSLLKMHDDTGDGNGSGAGGSTDATPEVWGLVVECESEEQQAQLAEELADRGLEVRALIPD